MGHLIDGEEVLRDYETFEKAKKGIEDTLKILLFKKDAQTKKEKPIPINQ